MRLRLEETGQMLRAQGYAPPGRCVMLKRLKLKNYRGFDDHSLPLRSLSVVVGHNNAGKSTLIEALRILSTVTERKGTLNFRDPPGWTNLPKIERGVSPSLDGLEIQLETIAHRYASAPAEVRATFTTGESIHLLITADRRCFAVLRDSAGNVIQTKGRARQASFPELQVLPQIAPLDQGETVIGDRYVLRNISSSLASRHFRNQLRLLRTAYPPFRQMAAETWPGIKVLELRGARGHRGEDLSLLIRDRDFVAEVAMMGHGLQMWLQTIWFLSRASAKATVVLDEPDVYMHPDLQRRLIRLVRNRFPQVVIATHSVEIVADVDPSEILIVDRRQPRSRFADSLPAVQKLIERIGGVHNVHLARLWTSRRLLLVEGDDLNYLKAVHDKLFPQSSVPLDDIPHSSIGGWTGWPYAIGQSMLARNALGQTVRVYCIFDSDYQIPEEIRDRQEGAVERDVELHVWEQKEIENYFILPRVIARVVVKRNDDLDEAEVRERVERSIREIVYSLEEVVFDAYADRFRKANPKRAGSANTMARARLEGVFQDPARALGRVSGKEVLRQLSAWLHQEYGRGVALRDILREMRREEVHPEVRRVLNAIETNVPFNA